MHSILFAATGFLAAGLGIWSWVPQLLRLRHTHDLSGFSRATLALTALSNGCWLAYGLLEPDTAQVVANGLQLLILVGVAVLVSRQTAAITTCLGASGAGFLTMIGSSSLTGVAATALACISLIPQARRALLSESVDGVSLGTALSLGAAGSLWLIHGLLGGMWALTVTNLVVAATSALILVGLLKPRMPTVS